MTSRSAVAALAALSLLCACEDSVETTPGRFEISLSFDGGGPQPEEVLFAHARVDEWPPSAVRGVTLVELSPERYRTGMSLDFDVVPHGPDRVVVVELRTGEDKRSPVRWFGRSAPFDFEAGSEVITDVPVPLAPGPGGGELRPDADLRVTLDDGSRPEVLPTSVVTVKIRALHSDSIELANNLAFSGAALRSVDALGAPDADGFFTWPEPWDLNAGLCDGADCVDGNRTLFAAVTGNGYRSELTPITLRIDTQAPELTVRVEREQWRAGEVLSVLLFSSEPLASVAPVLRGPDGETAAPSQIIQRTQLSYAFEWAVSALGADGLWRLEGEASDFAGARTSMANSDIEVRVDATVPSLLAAPELTPAAVGIGATVSLSLEVSEPLDLAATSLSLSGLPLIPGEAGMWSYVTTGEEGSGARQLEGELVDAFGNAQPLSAEASVRFDFDAPRLVGATVARRCDDAEGAVTADARGLLIWMNQPTCPEGAEPLELCFSASEAPADDDAPKVRAGDLVLTVAPVDEARLQWCAHYSPDGSEAQWAANLPLEHALEVTLADPFGNASTAVVGHLRFDFEPPAEPDVDHPSKIAYVRVPWGSADTGGQPRFSVTGGRDSTEPSVRLRVLSDSGENLGEGRADSRGGFEAIELLRTDRPRVSLQVIDAAGNVGAPSVVRNVRWIATLGGKEVANTDVNPHLLVGGPSRALPDVTDLGSLPELSDPGLAGLPDGAPQTQLSSAGYERIRDGNPLGRWAHSGAYDSHRGRFIIFGGIGDCEASENSYCGGTWEWNGERWLRRDPPESPPLRENAQMAYDPVRRVTVLVGGVRNDGRGCETAPDPDCRDTWLWDGERWERHVQPDMSMRTTGGGIAWDPERETLVLWGRDHDDPLAENATWSWDGTGWTRILVNSPSALRSDTAMVWDPNSDRMTLIGGVVARAGGNDVSSTVWQLQEEGWTEVPVTGATPAPRYRHAAAWNAAANEVVLLGGQLAGGNAVVDSPTPGFGTGWWAWDGGAWTRRSGPTGPYGRLLSVMKADPVGDRVLLFGGAADGRDCRANSNSSYCRGLWALEDGEWRALQEAAPLHVHYEAAAATDPLRGRVVIYGGFQSANGFVRLAQDTLEWDGERWYRHRTDPAPPERAIAQMAWDPASEEVILYGGDSQGEARTDTWSWNGERWRQLEGAEGPAVLGFNLVSDPPGRRVLLFGGCDQDGVCGDASTATWALEEGRWRQLQISSPGDVVIAPVPRRFATALYDAARGQHLLFSGVASDGVACGEGVLDRCHDTWVFAGDRWRQIDTPVRPVGRVSPAAFFDEVRGRAVVFGGGFSGSGSCASPDTVCADAWEWDGARWEQQGVTELPTRRRLAQAAWLPHIAGALIEGGLGPPNCQQGEACLSPYRWSAVGSPPTALFRAKLPAALAPPGSEGTAALLESFSFRAVTGGSGVRDETRQSAHLRVDLAIPDASSQGASATVNVDTPCELLAVEASVAVRHAHGETVSIALVSPSGTRVQLRDAGGVRERPDLVLHFPAPDVPVGSLENFAGEEAAGGWRFEVADLEADDVTGEIGQVGLALQCAAASEDAGVAMWVRAPGSEEGWLPLAEGTHEVEGFADLQATRVVGFGAPLGSPLGRWLEGGFVDLVIRPALREASQSRVELRVDYVETTVRLRLP